MRSLFYELDSLVFFSQARQNAFQPVVSTRCVSWTRSVLRQQQPAVWRGTARQ